LSRGGGTADLHRAVIGGGDDHDHREKRDEHGEQRPKVVVGIRGRTLGIELVDTVYFTIGSTA
jgi:hypothetical protein